MKQNTWSRWAQNITDQQKLPCNDFKAHNSEHLRSLLFETKQEMPKCFDFTFYLFIFIPVELLITIV